VVFSDRRFLFPDSGWSHCRNDIIWKTHVDAAELHSVAITLPLRPRGAGIWRIGAESLFLRFPRSLRKALVVRWCCACAFTAIPC